MSKRKKIKQEFPATLKLMERHGLEMSTMRTEDLIEAVAEELDLLGRMVASMTAPSEKQKIEIVPAGAMGRM